MKQYLYSFVFTVLAVFSFTSCANEIEGGNPVQGDSKISASIEKAQLATDEETHGISTRAAFNTDWSFFWTKKDKISVGVERNGEHSFATYMLSTGENTNSGTFVGSIVTGSTISGHVVYPSSLKPSISGSVLTIDKPQTITYTKEQETLGFDNVNPVDMPMYAHYSETGLKFKHMGAYFVFEISKMPAGSCYFVFSASSDIWGTFDVDLSEENPVYKTSSLTGSKNEIIISFPPTPDNATRLFVVPVPVGTYTFGWELYDEQEHLLAFGEQTEEKEMTRGRVRAYKRECGSTSTGDGSGSDSGGNSGGDAGNSGDTCLDLVNHTLNGHEFVDFGITCADIYGADCDHPTWHVVFAKTNIGAESEFDSGYYFRWGELCGWDIETANSDNTINAAVTSATQYDKDGSPTNRPWSSSLFSSSYVLYARLSENYAYDYCNFQGKTDLKFGQTTYGDAATYNWGEGWMMMDDNAMVFLSTSSKVTRETEKDSHNNVTGISYSDGVSTLYIPVGLAITEEKLAGSRRQSWGCQGYSTGLTNSNGSPFRYYGSSLYSGGRTHDDRYLGYPIRPYAFIPVE